MISWRKVSTLDPAYNEQKDAKETARYKWVLVVTELFNMAVNDCEQNNQLVIAGCLYTTWIRK